MKTITCAIICFGLTPLAVQAAVSINEIAWMGGTDSANHEWIELYNDGAATSVDGWLLTDGNNLNISLSGTIAGNSYAVLERTSDESAVGVAFLIYTGALNNSGATLTLQRPNGSVEDQVLGGDGWSNVGGNNSTKETAQYTSGGWITAEATPGTSNESVTNEVIQPEIEEEETEDEETSEQNASVSGVASSNGSGSVIELTLPDVTLELEIVAPEVVFVNQPVSFSVQASGVGETIKNSLQYVWNFGDTHTSELDNPTHIFSYPGTYLIHVSGTYARQRAAMTKTLTVLPVAVSISTNSANEVLVHNDSVYAVDISDYRLRAHETLVIPSNTHILPKQTITIPSTAVSYSGKEMIGLYDAMGTLQASVLPSITRHVSNRLSIVEESEVLSVTPQAVEEQSFSFASESITTPQATASPVTVDTTDQALIPEVENTQTNNYAVIGLIVLLLLGSGVVLMKPLTKTDSLDRHE